MNNLDFLFDECHPIRKKTKTKPHMKVTWKKTEHVLFFFSYVLEGEEFEHSLGVGQTLHKF